MAQMNKPNISRVYISSFNTNQAIMAVVGGTKKNKLDVFEADPFLIKYINIVNAPKDTKTICQLIDKMNEILNLI